MKIFLTLFLALLTASTSLSFQAPVLAEGTSIDDKSSCDLLIDLRVLTPSLCRRTERNITKAVFVRLLMNYKQNVSLNESSVLSEEDFQNLMYSENILRGQDNSRERTSLFQKIDRSTAATILTRVSPELLFLNPRSRVPDLRTDLWYYPYSFAVLESGVMLIDERNLFKPSENVTYDEAFEIVLRLHRFFLLRQKESVLSAGVELQREDFLALDLKDIFRDASLFSQKPIDEELPSQLQNIIFTGKPELGPTKSEEKEPELVPSDDNIVTDRMNTNATQFISPTSALGESGVEIFAVQIRAQFGLSYDIRQLSIELASGPGVSLQDSIRLAQATFLNIFLESVDSNGIRRRISGPESLNSNGEIIFDRFQGDVYIKNGDAVDLFLVSDINSASTGAAGYLFKLSTDNNTLLDQNQRVQPSSLLSK